MAKPGKFGKTSKTLEKGWESQEDSGSLKD